MLGLHILDDDGNPIPCDDVLTWGDWFGAANRRVALDMVDDAEVSTVFTGIDYSFAFGGPPQLYETMIFGGLNNEYQERYATREEALAGHQRAVRACIDKQRLEDLEELDEPDEDPPKEIDWFAYNRS